MASPIATVRRRRGAVGGWSMGGSKALIGPSLMSTSPRSVVQEPSIVGAGRVPAPSSGTFAQPTSVAM